MFVRYSNSERVKLTMKLGLIGFYHNLCINLSYQIFFLIDYLLICMLYHMIKLTEFKILIINKKKNCKLTGGFGEHNKYKPLGVVNYFLI